MSVRVAVSEGSHRLSGDGPITELANRYLAHLEGRSFSGSTVRGYAFDLLNFSRFLSERRVPLAEVAPQDLFDWLNWQQAPKLLDPVSKVVGIGDLRGAAPATINRRVAAVRGMFEYATMTGVRSNNPVPPGRRSTGLRARPQGMLGHVGTRRARSDGRLVRQPRRLPESVDQQDVLAFVSDLQTYRDRALVLAMVLGGLRAAEVRGMLLKDVDMGLRRLRVWEREARSE